MDRNSETIPILSTATSLVAIFSKCAVLPCQNRRTIATNPYYHHIEQKSFSRCVCLLIPFLGNLIVYLGNEEAEEKKDEGKSSTHGSSSAYSFELPEQPIPTFSTYSGLYSNNPLSSFNEGTCCPITNPFDLYTTCRPDEQG